MTGLLQDYARARAASGGDALALVMDDTRMTYAQLDEQSNRLAHLLRDAGCRRGDRVCLFQNKTPAAVMAMHAIMKADCAYVPIDLSSPASRAARIVLSCRPKVILADQSATKLLSGLVPMLAESGQVVIGTTEQEPIVAESFRSQFDASDAERMDSGAPECNNTPSDPAHILFTSGSTGTPKGVVITHANVCHFVDWARVYFGITAGDRVSSHPPLHFDLSTFDIYGTFSAGAQLHLVPPLLNLVPAKLAKFMRDTKLTQWFSVPSALTLMAQADVVQDGDFPGLERLLWCGEVLPTPVLIYWMERLPHVKFTNLYGPTEATIASSYFTVDECPKDPLQQIPIGRACDREELMVLDSNLDPKPFGETGDLYIAGAGLSPHYWEDEEKTNEVFLTRHDAGDVPQRIYKTGDLAYRDAEEVFYFVGRSDTQIKSRGYRIELGEIEAAMNALGVLRDCAVVGVTTGGFEGTAICCAYVAQEDFEVSPQSLRTKASKLLPSYMMPARWIDFPELPKNGSGKTDRSKLKQLFGAGAVLKAKD